jgi:membrane protease YdiL (CAAX protease family)
MVSLAAFGRRHPVAAYFALTFLISWGGVLLVIARSRGMTARAPADEPFFAYALVAMLAGPTVAGIVLTVLTGGRRGLDDFRRRVLAWRAGLRWCAVALLAAPVLWLVTMAMLAGVSPSFVPALVTSTDRTTLVATGLAAALVAGVFEELGWTGFAIPQLRRRHGIFATGLLVGVLWGGWHVLTNVIWAAPVTAGAWPLAVFLPASVLSVLVGYLAAFRVLMVWVYDHTESMLVAMAMHASLTASVLILDPASLVGGTLLAYAFALAAAVWFAVLVVAWRSGGR